MVSTLYAYRVDAYKRGDKGAGHPLDDLRDDGSGELFLTTFDELIKKDAEWPPPPEDGHEDTRTRINTVVTVGTPTGDPNVRYGLIRVEKPAVAQDIETTKHGPVEVDADDPTSRPIFFWFGFPASGASGLLLTERAGSFSIVTNFWRDHVIREINKKYDDVTITIDPYVPVKAWELYRDHGQQVEGMELVKVINETKEVGEGETRTERVGEVHHVVKRKGLGKRQQEVTAILRSTDVADAKKRAIQLVGAEYASGDADWDSVILDLEISDRIRRARIGRETVAQLGYPADDVKVDSRGLPEVASMLDFATHLAGSIGGAIGL